MPDYFFNIIDNKNKKNNNQNYNTPSKPGKTTHFKTDNKINLNPLMDKTKNYQPFSFRLKSKKNGCF